MYFIKYKINASGYAPHIYTPASFKCVFNESGIFVYMTTLNRNGLKY